MASTMVHDALAPTAPATMRAARFDAFGGPEVLVVREVPVPRAAEGEVLVRVEASGVNPKDALFRAKAPTPWRTPRFPRATGFDLAGAVVGCGPGVVRLRPGQPVWGFLDGTAGGAAAEYVAVPERWLAVRPQGLSAAAAATLPLVASAALQALRDVAGLRPGERVLIKGAAGGVGRAAIQIARVLGAEVTAMADGRRGEDCVSAGAHAAAPEGEILDGPDASFDVFLDCGGGSRIVPYSRLLRRGGRWVTVAPNTAVFVLTPLSFIAGLVGLPRFGFVVVRPRSEDLETIGRWVAEGVLEPPPLAPFALDDVAKAHEEATRRGRVGRPVLVVSDGPPAWATRSRSREVAT